MCVSIIVTGMTMQSKNNITNNDHNTIRNLELPVKNNRIQMCAVQNTVLLFFFHCTYMMMLVKLMVNNFPMLNSLSNAMYFLCGRLIFLTSEIQESDSIFLHSMPPTIVGCEQCHLWRCQLNYEFSIFLSEFGKQFV